MSGGGEGCDGGVAEGVTRGDETIRLNSVLMKGGGAVAQVFL